MYKRGVHLFQGRLLLLHKTGLGWLVTRWPERLGTAGSGFHVQLQVICVSLGTFQVHFSHTVGK